MLDKAFKRVKTFEDFRTELVEGKEKRAGAELILESKASGKRAWIICYGMDMKNNVLIPHVEDEVWKLQNGYKVLEWKLYDSCGVHFLRMQSMQIYMLVEKKYPLTPSTFSMMLEKKLQIDYESEMAYQLFNVAEGVNAASEEVSTDELVSTAYLKEFDLLKWDQQVTGVWSMASNGSSMVDHRRQQCVHDILPPVNTVNDGATTGQRCQWRSNTPGLQRRSTTRFGSGQVWSRVRSGCHVAPPEWATWHVVLILHPKASPEFKTGTLRSWTQGLTTLPAELEHS
ncbi:hypothetical protein Tco_0078377 [Tanacetum coccineum]